MVSERGILPLSCSTVSGGTASIDLEGYLMEEIDEIIISNKDMPDGFCLTPGEKDYAVGRLRKYPDLEFPLDNRCTASWLIRQPDLGAETPNTVQTDPAVRDPSEVLRLLGLESRGSKSDDELACVQRAHVALGHPPSERLAKTLTQWGLQISRGRIESLVRGCEVCKDKPKAQAPVPLCPEEGRKGQAQQDLTEMSPKGVGGELWISTIYDLEHRFISAMAIKAKSDAWEHTGEFLKTRPWIKVLRTDNAPELTGAKMKAVLAKHGVTPETTAPGSSFSNGGVERAHRTIKETIQTLMRDVGVWNWPELWSWFVGAAADCHNRSYCAAIKKSPLESMGEEIKPPFFGDGVHFTNRSDKKGRRQGIFLHQNHSGSMEILEPVLAEDSVSRQIAHPRTVSRTSMELEELIREEIRKISRTSTDLSGGKKTSRRRNTRKSVVRTIRVSSTNSDDSWLVIGKPSRSLAFAAKEHDGPRTTAWIRLEDYPCREKVLCVTDDETFRTLRINKGHYLHGYGYVAEDEARPEEVDTGKFTAADEKEWSQVIANNVLEYLVTDGETPHPPIRTRFRRTYKADGTPKTRFIVCATNDKRDVPTTTHLPMPYARRICHIAGASKGWRAATVDVKTAFLLVPLDEQVFIRLPDRLPANAIAAGHVPRGVYKLRKALYGLKESPRLFEKFLTGKLIELGYKKVDDGVFVRQGEAPGYLVTYVDDILCWSDDPIRNLGEITRVVPCAEIQKVSDRAIRYIGEDIVSPDDGVIVTSMSSYIGSLPPPDTWIEKCPTEYHGRKLKHLHLPLADFRESFDNLEAHQKEAVIDAYRQIVGTIGWISTSHPALAYTFGELARYTQSPGPTAMRVALGAMREILNCKDDLQISFGAVHRPQVRIWMDASVQSMRSRRGWIVQLVDEDEPLTSRRNLVAWKSAKDDTMHESTVSAEVNAIRHTVTEVSDILFTVRMVLGLPLSDIPTLLLTDSESGRLQILNETGTKEQRIRSEFIKDWMHRMDIPLANLRHVPGDINLADPLTKPKPFKIYTEKMD